MSISSDFLLVLYTNTFLFTARSIEILIKSSGV